VKASLGQLGTITDVMQPNRRDKRPIKEAEPFADTFRLGSRALDVPPATRQGQRQVLLSQRASLGHLRHGPRAYVPRDHAALSGCDNFLYGSFQGHTFGALVRAGKQGNTKSLGKGETA
jgi:hypothetical protein